MAMNYVTAISDFREARRRAAMEQILARLRGGSADLLSYEEVREKLKAQVSQAVELKEIPLAAIVGSVGRYTDFTRSFLPKHDSDRERWARVEMAVTDLSGTPPIEVYQIGDVYFVRDGHHRVSVARKFGATQIQAYVTEIHSRVPLSPDTQADDLILKAEHAGFLEKTSLDRLRPGADASTTVPGSYQTLEEHIEVHRYFMGLEQQREIPYEEAVAHWYDEVYWPVVQAIRGQGILDDFPGRTETDLYLWVAEHRAVLEQTLGWEIETEMAIADLATRHSSKARRVVARVGERILDLVVPDEFEAGPPPGQWREERLASRREDCLLADILVPVSGEEMGWNGLEQALALVRCERARLRGLHIVPTEEHKQSEQSRALQAEFHRRCEVAGAVGNLVIEVGKVARTIVDQARWTDLVVVNLAYPPAPQPVARLSSGFRTLLLRCPRPVLAVPGMPSPLSHALLAYNGGPKSKEALFVATYLAGQWHIPLTVVSILEEDRVTPETLAQAGEYLESHGMSAVFVQAHGSVAEMILKTAEERGCDLILMGGYGHGPVVEAVLGSVVDHVLRASQQPVLICS
jgi:nucleotide-binding universal stress UspA family protein